MAMATDPVCGMEVDTDTAAATSDYKGQTYYFCAPGCKKQFDRNPERYLGTSDVEKEHTSHEASAQAPVVHERL